MSAVGRRVVLAGAVAAPVLLATPANGLARSLRDLEAGYPGRIGVAAFNTGTGARVSYRADERFALASTFKALASAAILRKARSCEPGLLDQVIHWDRSKLVDYSPITAQHMDDGMTVAQLCEAAITYSDNTAGNLLLEQLGGPAAIGRFTRTLGDFHTRLDRTEPTLNTNIPGDPQDTTTPAAMASNLYALTLGVGLTEPDLTQLKNWLIANKTGGERIRAGLPKDWKVGDKTGSAAYGMLNDIAIAWPPNAAPLIIAVYTTRTDPNTQGDNRILADIARYVAATIGPR